MAAYRWKCACCGKAFDTLPMCWDVGPPTPYQALTEEERTTRARLGSDACIVDRQAYIRGHIEIPVLDTDDMFSWNVWVSLSDASVHAIGEAQDSGVWDGVGPFFGWLCSALPYEPTTVALKTMVHMRPPNFVPYIEVEPTDHPLAVEQRSGVTLARVAAIAGLFALHQQPGQAGL